MRARCVSYVTRLRGDINTWDNEIALGRGLIRDDLLSVRSQWSIRPTRSRLERDRDRARMLVLGLHR